MLNQFALEGSFGYNQQCQAVRLSHLSFYGDLLVFNIFKFVYFWYCRIDQHLRTVKGIRDLNLSSKPFNFSPA